MKMHPGKRIIAVALAFVLALGLVTPAAYAADPRPSLPFQQVDNDEVTASLLHKTEEEEETPAAAYAADETVRVSIVLDQDSTLAAGYESEDIAANRSAMRYRDKLLKEQEKVTDRIEQALDEDLDVVWNLTLAANIISANVDFGQIDQIARVRGVEKVFVEQTYKPLESVQSAEAKPNMVISSQMTGANLAWETGYHGAGTRIAVIDTGLDTDHQSFDPAALEYAYAQDAKKAGLSYEDYVASLHLLDKDEIASVLPQLNIHKLMPELTADDLYVNTKAPFGVNYIDKNLTITHDNDSASEHGSHVSGISSANRYIKQGEEFVSAADTVYTLGNAPDSQIIVMKVFGENSPTDADYMAALEDAILLNCDVANLSLGGSNPGGTISLDYQDIMDSLVNSDTVVAIAAGNEGPWSAHANGYKPNLYVEDVSMQTASEPATFTNSLAVASVDNNGMITTSLLYDGHRFGYVDGKGDWHDPLASLDAEGKGAEYDFVMLTTEGKEEDYAGIDVTGKIAMVSRGDINFTDKADAAVEQGAIATLVYNNVVDNTIMVMDGYWSSQPCAMIAKDAADTIKASAEKHTTEAGVVYYTGKITVDGKLSPVPNGHDYNTMSAFSSWGVPGDLSMKPEISAPGGNIYSVNGAVPETDQYEMMSGTSMATPQVAGLSALVMEHIRTDHLHQEGMTDRALAQSLLMSTADPMVDENGKTISILQQGAGLANILDALSAQSFVTVDGQNDGKVKVELGDDPQRTGSYTFSFDIHNLTDAQQLYALSADVFTQDTFEDYANKEAAAKEDKTQMATYMDYATRALASTAAWSADNGIISSNTELEDCDFNGDGHISQADAQALLDYLTGERKSISNADFADVNHDGKVNTYDAHAFLANCHNDVVLVPAGETVQVNVTLNLTDEAKAYIDETYPNGAYLQAFVNAQGLGDAEGVAGTAHNIPVLGFYGSWTDPSMFELGTIQEKLSGQEIRTTYTGEGEATNMDGEEIAPSSYNTLEVEYYRDPGYSYLLGGNPVDPEETPNPQRTAINNTNGDKIHSYNFSPIRNAAASRVQMTDADGNVLFQRFPGPYYGAYYGIMMFFPMWINSNYRYPINFVPGSLAEGDSFTTSVTLAPEYNTDMVEEKADWDALGHGATLSTTVRIDNTAPEILDIRLTEDQRPTITVEAKDNQYIAGVALFDRGGRTVLDSTGSIADAHMGDTDEFTLSTANANGKKFLIQVFDYAYNVSTYELNMEIGDPVPLPQLLAQDLEYAEYDPAYWVGFDVNADYKSLSTYAKSGTTFHAATLADPYIYAVSEDGVLYVMHKEDLMSPIRVGQLPHKLDDMAYSVQDDTIYGVYQTEDGQSVLTKMDKLTGELTDVGPLAIHTNTLAVNAEGTFYANALDTSKVYTFTADTLSAPVQAAECLDGDDNAPFQASGIQAMEYDPNTGNVVWVSYKPGSWSGESWLFEIQPDNTVVTHNDMMHHLTALVIPDVDARNEDYLMDDAVTGMSLSDDTVFVMKSQSYQLTADVLPWTAADRFVYWESDNTDVATVDGKGLIDAVGVGTATITARSRLDESFVDTVTVHVTDIKVTVNGIVSDSSGKPSTFSWNMEEANDWTADMDLDTDVMAATAKDDWTYFVTSGTGRTVKKIDFGTSETLHQWQRPMNDLAYSTVFSGEKDLVHAAYMTLWLPAKDMNATPDGAAWDLTSVLESSNGGVEFEGLASGGPIQYTEADGVTHDAELLYFIDNKGGVLKLYAYEMSKDHPDYDPEYPYNAGAEYYPSDLAEQGYAPAYDDNDNPLSSLVVGNDGNLYFAAFNGDTSQLYQLVFNAETKRYDATMFADMGHGVWPTALTKVTVNEADTTAVGTAKATADTMTLSDVAGKAVLDGKTARAAVPAASATHPVAAFLAPVFAAAADLAPAETQDVTITLTNKDVPSTNGFLTVKYDSELLTLKSVEEGLALVNSDHSEPGVLTFAYADVAALEADSQLATLTFEAKAGISTDVTITTTQRNADEVEDVETITIETEQPEQPDPETPDPENPENPENPEGPVDPENPNKPTDPQDKPGTDEPAGPDTDAPAEKPQENPEDKPDTGDSFHAALWLTLLAASGLAVTLVIRRKRS